MSNISLMDCVIQDLLENHYVNEAVNQIIQAEYCSHSNSLSRFDYAKRDVFQVYSKAN